jgi:hypothetical protein
MALDRLFQLILFDCAKTATGLRSDPTGRTFSLSSHSQDFVLGYFNLLPPGAGNENSSTGKENSDAAVHVIVLHPGTQATNLALVQSKRPKNGQFQLVFERE